MSRGWVYQQWKAPGAAGATPLSFRSLTIQQSFEFRRPGWVMGASLLCDDGDTNLHFATFVSQADALEPRAVACFRQQHPSGSPTPHWTNAYFHPRRPVVTGVEYFLTVWFQYGPAFYFPNALASGPVTTGDIQTGVNATDNGACHYGLDPNLNPGILIPNAAAAIDVLFLKK